MNFTTDSFSQIEEFVASKVAMVSPRSFCSNPQTLQTNVFQVSSDPAQNEKVLEQAKQEFLRFQKKLIDAGIEVLKFEEKPDSHTPDALFLNNWFCHLPDGRVVLFPMLAENRRSEYREDVIDSLMPLSRSDLRYLAHENAFLEGTGSLIFDHAQQMAYACRSPRTTDRGLQVFSEVSNYSIIAFSSTDEKNVPIYHTNVMMTLSPQIGLICLESIKNTREKNIVMNSFMVSGRQIVDITLDQVRNFVGNMLFLENKKGQRFWVCSERAYKSLTEEQKKTLEEEAQFLYSPLDTIETYGGGGARCLLAEIF